MPHLTSLRLHLPSLASSLLVSSIWLLPGAGLSFDVRDVPNPRHSHGGWVADMAGILRTDTETSINDMEEVIGILSPEAGNNLDDSNDPHYPSSFLAYSTILFVTLLLVLSAWSIIAIAMAVARGNDDSIRVSSSYSSSDNDNGGGGNNSDSDSGGSSSYSDNGGGGSSGGGGAGGSW